MVHLMGVVRGCLLEWLAGCMDDFIVSCASRVLCECVCEGGLIVCEDRGHKHVHS